MSFFERAKAAASDLASKADQALANSGIAGQPTGQANPKTLLHDLGVLTYLEATGRAVDPADRNRIMEAMRGLEAAGQLGPLTITPPAPPAPTGPPPPPGAAAQGYAAAPPPPPAAAPPPPPPGAATPPPPPVQQQPMQPAEGEGVVQPGSTPPPPPPSW